MKNLTKGGATHYWVNDYLKLGMTTNRSNEPGNESSLTGGDLTLRQSAQTWLKVEKSNSDGINSTSFVSNDGGFNFGSTTTTLVGEERVQAGAKRVDTSIGFNEIRDGAKGNMTFYRQSVDAGYSAPGINAFRDTEQQGMTVNSPVNDQVGVRAKTDKKIQDQGLHTSATELNVDSQMDDHWQCRHLQWSGACRSLQRRVLLRYIKLKENAHAP